MVEQSYKQTVGPLIYHGDYYSGKDLCEMAVNSLRTHEVIGRIVGNDKDLSGFNETKKSSLVWRLFLSVLIGACGLCICLAGVGHRLVSPGPSSGSLYQSSSGLCLRSAKSSNDDILEHYPKPQNYSRDECACTPVHYFVILSMQRSGSGWFETLLNDHPNISSHGEVFAAKERRENFTTIKQTLDTVYNLDWQSSAVKDDCTSAVGHKWMLNQGVMEYHREVADYYKDKGVSVVILLRRNLLKRLISILANAYDKKMKPLNGTHKSHVHLPEEAKVLAEYKPTINGKHLQANLRRVQEITGDALHFFDSTRLIKVYYEDLVKDPKKVLEVQSFLGVPPRDLSSKQVKIHTKPLREQIENWEEVLKRLKGTPFESFLGDTDYS
ncbi:unnamed protein product [Calypogeia fissa]